MHVDYIVNTMAADDLAPCIIRASAALVLTYFSHNNLGSAPEGLSYDMYNWRTDDFYHKIQLGPIITRASILHMTLAWINPLTTEYFF